MFLSEILHARFKFMILTLKLHAETRSEEGRKRGDVNRMIDHISVGRKMHAEGNSE